MTSPTLAPAEPDHVIASIVGRRGMILLDRGPALNALTTGMVAAIHQALVRFAQDDRVQFVTIGSTRPGVFCAGGDIRAVREASLAGRHEDNEAFFTQEFALNRFIAEYPKPYVALIDGVCMGGGMGLSIHGRHRVVTHEVTMAMPETAIGYFPDVGASHFLNRLPGAIGPYLALTGARVRAADAIYAGLATAVTDREGLAVLSDRLDRIEAKDLEAAIRESVAQPPEPGELATHREAIDRCFGAEDMGEVVRRLEAEGSPFAKGILKTFDSLSPTSLCVTLALLRQTRGLSLPACLDIELRLTRAMTRGHDFAEGVRAMLVDKDRKPRWISRDWSRIDILTSV